MGRSGRLLQHEHAHEHTPPVSSFMKDCMRADNQFYNAQKRRASLLVAEEGVAHIQQVRGGVCGGRRVVDVAFGCGVLPSCKCVA